MSAPTCLSCSTTANVWSCVAGSYCRLHLPLNAGVLWRTVVAA